jgi:uncharacterized protein (DUF2235 family)
VWVQVWLTDFTEVTIAIAAKVFEKSWLISSGALGYGVSANVRAAYGFLAHNYDDGDEIFFFGFSRGAYTARAIASLVAETGLLTKRGMDRFPELYNTYYDYAESKKGRSETPEAKRRAKEYIRHLGDDEISHSAAHAIQIVGIWDTVAFHKPIFGNIFLFRILGFQFNQERIEFSDTLIPRRIRYGFHALSLDETRKAYLPTMWTLPRRPDSSRRQPTLKQVWFTGEHGDVGGGRDEHRLSDIALVWMISECSKTGLLSFDPDYLLRREFSGNMEPLRIPWATYGGKTKLKGGITTALKIRIEKLMGTVARQPLMDRNPTNETIHCSIADRKFGWNDGALHATRYESNCIVGWYKGGWEVEQGRNARRKKLLQEAEIGQVELELKGKIRSATDAD